MKRCFSLALATLFTLPVCFLTATAFGQGTVLPANLPPTPGGLRNHPGDFSPAQLATMRSTNEAIARGEAMMKTGDLSAAISSFQEALSYENDNGLAYQRLAETQTVIGRLTEAAATYRTLLCKWPGKSWSDMQNGDPSVHMQFTLVLLRLHQRAEALSVYQRGYQLLQSEEAPIATTSARGLLPPMIDSPDFTAAQFEAAADTVIGIHKYDWISQDLARADFQHALSLQPSLAVPYFYLGQIDKVKSGHSADAMAAFDRAARLGGPEMRPFVDRARKEGTYEFTDAVKKAASSAQP